MYTLNYKLSKSTFMKGSQCIKSLYLNKFHKDLRDPVSESKQAIFDTGHQVGDLAQSLFPGGINSDFSFDLDADKASAKTLELIKSGQKVIYEAAFIYDECLAVMDILVNDGKTWKAYEVKSSTSAKEEYKLDASYQYYVIENSGIHLEDVSIVYINNQYVRQGELDIFELFSIESVLDIARSSINVIRESIVAYKKILESGKIPEMGIGEYCSKPYDCDFLSHCWEHIPEDSIFDISGMFTKKKFELYNSGIVKISDIPANFKLNANQQLQVNSALNNSSFVYSSKIKSFLTSLNYPLLFLDFETIRPAVPVYKNHRPYQQIPFQYSLHIVSNQGCDSLHFDFLATGLEDPRKALIESLIEQTKGTGDILVYNETFERKRLEEIARDFPEYTNDIESMLMRLKDLMIPFKDKYYYKPEMRGSYSIKEVLPALVPELKYDGLTINNGDLASITFMKIVNKEFSESEVERIRKDLLEYCKLDTLAMVKILEVLYGVE